MKRICLALVLLFASTADAHHKLLDLSNVKDGTYVLTVVGDSVAVEATKIIEPGVEPTPDPTPNPDPLPVTLTERGIKIRDAAKAVVGDADRDTTARGLAVLYREIAKAKLAPDVSLKAIKMATDAYLNGRPAGVAKAWQPVRDVMTACWTDLVQKGAKEPDFTKLLNEAADGLDASSKSRALSPELIQLILMLVKLILEMIGG